MSDNQDIEDHNIWKAIDNYSRFSEAEALILVNPTKLSAYVAGTAISNEFGDVCDKMKTSLWNLGVAADYIATSPTQEIYSQPFLTVLEDTAYAKTMCETGDQVGAFAAGCFVNKRIIDYSNEIVESSTKEYEMHQDFEMNLNRRHCKAKS